MIKVVILGAGYMAEEHAKVFSSLENVKISGIYSRSKDKAIHLAKKYNIDLISENIQQLYALTKADLVINTVSVISIFETTKICLNFPWTILVEKPPGHNLNEALELNKIVKSKNCKFFVALNRRHYSSVYYASKELMFDNSKRIVKVIDQEDLNDPKRIGHPLKVINNWMFANSIHLIDYFSIFCRGNLNNVQHITPWNPNKPFFVSAQLEFDSGDIGLYECYWNSPAPWSVSINTNSLRLDMTPLESLTKQSYGSRKRSNIELDEVDFKFKPGLFKQAKEIISSIKGDKNNLPTLDDAIKTMHLVDSIYFKL